MGFKICQFIGSLKLEIGAYTSKVWYQWIHFVLFSFWNLLVNCIARIAILICIVYSFMLSLSFFLNCMQNLT